MERKIISVLLTFALFSAPGFAALSRAVGQARQPLVVVVAESTGIHDISLATLRRVFVGSPAEYRSGKRFLPLNHAIGTPDRIFFDWVVLGIAPEDIGRYWVDQKIRGTSQPPRSLASAELAVRVVASFPGAITYCDPRFAGPTLTVLNIDGKPPSDPDYPLLR